MRDCNKKRKSNLPFFSDTNLNSNNKKIFDFSKNNC